MQLYQEYLKPQTIAETVDFLTSAKGSIAVVSGGTDLLLDIKQGRHDPVDQMVDVSGIKEMSQINLEDDYIYLGAAVTHKQIIKAPLLQEHARCVVEGCGLFVVKQLLLFFCSDLEQVIDSRRDRGSF